MAMNHDDDEAKGWDSYENDDCEIKKNCWKLPFRVSHNTPFFELCYVLLTTHAIGLEEATKKFQRYRK